METIIATNIDTNLFYSIIKHLTDLNWKISIEYSNKIFDKGIDFDLYQLENGEEKIVLAWTNWFEGELKAAKMVVKLIEKDFGVTFKFGKPERLENSNLIDDMKELLDFKK